MKELIISPGEREQLTAFYLDEVKDNFLREYPDNTAEDNWWSGIGLGARMFDLCVYWFDEQITCLVYECHKDQTGQYLTDTNRETFLKLEG
jgi:hypothetical protein